MHAAVEPAAEIQLTQMLENSMTENAEATDAAMEQEDEAACKWKLWRRPKGDDDKGDSEDNGS